jgi:mono/diheme cytochrome c family protein
VIMRKVNGQAYFLSALSVTVVLLTGCSKSPVSSPDVPISPTYSSIAANILQPDCVYCHSGANGYAFDTYANTMKEVSPGDTSSSALYTAVSSGQMPMSGNRLSQKQIQAIADWIMANALNN